MSHTTSTQPPIEGLPEYPEHPRRQIRRPSWQSLDGPWRFAIDVDGTAEHPRRSPELTDTIEVPFAPETARSGIGDTGWHADVWYQRDFTVVRDETLPRVLLHFGAVDYAARVWVNDRFVGSHEGGHTPFSFDIADSLVESDVQTVTVWAHDDPHDLTKPRGKQDWQVEPHSIWYPRTTGIWQSVWLEQLPAVSIERLHWTPDLGRWEIAVSAFIARRDHLPLRLRVRLSVGDRVLADDTYGIVESEVHRRIALSDPGIDDFRNELLWSPERPTLIDALVQVIHDSGRVLDEVESYTALRGVELLRGRFMLNRRPYYLRLALDQGYWAESLMTPPSEAAIVSDIRLLKAAGFNGVRKHQKVEDPRFLYWADRLGLLVWEEMPSVYRFTRESMQNIAREWTEVIDRDVDHPCIVVWVPFNESWGVPDLPSQEAHRTAVQALYFITRTLDPTRPVIGNDGWESSATDIVGIHDYDADPRRLLARYCDDGGTGALPDVLVNGFPGGRVITLEGHPHAGQPVMLTEFGGIAHRDPRSADQAGVWGYSETDSSDDLRQRYVDLLDAVNRVEAFSGFCYTQFADTFQEANGLFYDDRTPKFDLTAMRAATCGTGHLGEPPEAGRPPLVGH